MITLIFSVAYILEPVKLSGEGKFNLNIVKEIKVTDSFLGLHQSVRGCQNETSQDDCTTKHYLDSMKQHCGCLLPRFRISKKVSFGIMKKYKTLFIYS